MRVHTVSEAKAQLSKLFARAENGEEVIIGRNGRPVAKLVRVEQSKKVRTPGVLTGKMIIPDDFDRFPDGIARALGIID